MTEQKKNPEIEIKLPWDQPGRPLADISKYVTQMALYGSAYLPTGYTPYPSIMSDGFMPTTPFPSVNITSGVQRLTLDSQQPQTAYNELIAPFVEKAMQAESEQAEAEKREKVVTNADAFPVKMLVLEQSDLDGDALTDEERFELITWVDDLGFATDWVKLHVAQLGETISVTAEYSSKVEELGQAKSETALAWQYVPDFILTELEAM